MMGYGFGIWSVISSVLSAVLGGGMVYLFTIKSQKRKAKAEAEMVEANADGVELSNVEKAIKIWREMAESLACELEQQRKKSDELKTQIDKLTREVCRLSSINTKILHLLHKITPENLEQIVDDMKKIIEK